ncbi:conjugal transfer protein TraD [Blastomonas sp. AAP53]|uniref:conjugal transfer protein TraD n=1 Tax=Blastomonas sp. AAP53 TaxID=1248760 RepID=UPI001EE65EDE|nr:conjugal transfer protein TraD [Blastomonas sp. AAP53]
MASRAALRKTQAQRNRLMLAKARNDTRDWRVTRRERTRRLIELGGLVVKSGFDQLVDDDRAVIYGLLVEAAAKVRDAGGPQQITRWRRRGARAFAQNQLAS